MKKLNWFQKEPFCSAMILWFNLQNMTFLMGTQAKVNFHEIFLDLSSSMEITFQCIKG